MIKQNISTLIKLTRIGQYIKNLKKENSELRKIIIKNNNELQIKSQEIETIKKERDDDLDFMQKIVYAAARDAFISINLEPTEDMLEEYIDELSIRIDNMENNV